MTAPIASIMAQILLGWILADFLTGLFHWIEDRFGRPQMPVLGPLVFEPNRLHHAQPVAFTGDGFVTRNWTTWLGAAILWGPMFLMIGAPAWAIVGAFGTAMSNQIHYWAHRPSLAPGWAKPLQALGLLQSARHHARHHRPPHLTRYCINTDWLNPVLDTVKFWSLLEAPLPRRWFA
ncbi:MAG: hypothetical protein COW16_10405 [Sphingomonadales bacterium CG12_big_fil_rev_8_21_14_0_65_65_10]|nr:MAG: hypothetical protein COW16_10405 [Sphingomonadales bacterium CG12_big_fil_rev_8_21_14_0_65_65_10]